MYEGYSESYSEETSLEAVQESGLIWSKSDSHELFELTSRPTERQFKKMLGLYEQQEEVSFSQNPFIGDLIFRNGKILFFTYKSSLELQAYAVINQVNARVAEIDFGPVYKDREGLLRCMDELIPALREALGVWFVKLQLPGQIDSENFYVDRKIRQKFSVRRPECKLNWGSSVIDTQRPQTEIRAKFSKNHKRSLKKAEKLGVTTRRLDSRDEIEAFNDIFVRMYEARGVAIDRTQNLIDYKSLFNHFEKTDEGFFFGAFDDQEELIGGMIILKQGNYGFYHHSASDPLKRKIPVLHKAIFDVLEELRRRDIRYFDFGGYNHMVDEKDQVYNINRFKDGFTKDYTFYLDVMYIEYVPGAVKAEAALQFFKNCAKKLIGR